MIPVNNRPARIVPVAALVLCPEEIANYHSFFYALHIHSGSKTPFEMFPLDEIQVGRHFKNYSEEAKALLCKINDGDIGYEIDLLTRKHGREKSGLSIDKYLERTVIRYFHSLFTDLIKLEPGLRAYHRIKNDKGNYIISKCTIHNEKPTLSFEVRKNNNNALYIEPVFHCSKGSFEAGQIKFYKFLADIKDGEYFCLSHSDYLTLEWLRLSQPEQHSLTPQLFSQRIVQKLEETHRVNRNDLFEKQLVDGVPDNCVYLSEISESMLMFTPKWNYGGILIEGEWKEQHETIRNGQLYCIKRGKEAEQYFIDYLQSLHPNFAKQSPKFFYLGFSDAKKKQWFLKTYHQLLQNGVQIIGLEMLRHFRYSDHSPVNDLKIIAKEKEQLTLKLAVRFGKELIPLSELQKILMAGQSSVLLKDNTIGVFPDEWMEQYAPVIKHGKISGDEISIPQWMGLSLEEGEARKVFQETIAQDWIEKWYDWQSENKTVYPVPSGVHAQLRPYQHKGFEWMALLSEIGAGACLADDMGLGKTLQTITFLCHRHQQEDNIKDIIICPASLIYNWQAELSKFAPHLSVYIYNGSARNIDHCFESGASIMITTYGTLRSDIEKLKLIRWDTAIVDESHNIKNIRAQSTKATLQITARNRIALSGTPVMNNTFDLYAQLGFLLPNLLGGQEFFKKEYADPIDVDKNPEKIKALQKLTGPFILRRTKEQVAADLPAKTESILWCDMGKAQRIHYESIKDQIRDSIFTGIKNEGVAKNKLNILQGILKLRQICGSPQLLTETSSCTESIKISMLIDELEYLKDNKALVFSQFKGMLHLVASECRKRHVPYFHFDGDTPVQQRQEMVQKFQEEGDPTKLFLISLKSGNAGLNLTAADYVFLMDPWWNAAVQQQAIDRTHRIGQTKNVFAYKMICKNTIEEKIIEMQEKKKALSDELVSAEDGFVKNLTEQDIKYLFE